MRRSDESGLRDIRPNHLFQRAVRQTKSETKVEKTKVAKTRLDVSPGCQVHFQGLASIGEDVESDLGSFLLQISDKLLQQSDTVNLEEQQE